MTRIDGTLDECVGWSSLLTPGALEDYSSWG